MQERINIRAHQFISGAMVRTACGILANCIVTAPSFFERDIIEPKHPDFIADACVPLKYVQEMRRLGYGVIYINEINGRMQDWEIIQMGLRLGVPIATQNIRHFEPYCRLIPLKSRKSVHTLVRETLKHLSRGKIAPQM